MLDGIRRPAINTRSPTVRTCGAVDKAGAVEIDGVRTGIIFHAGPDPRSRGQEGKRIMESVKITSIGAITSTGLLLSNVAGKATGGRRRARLAPEADR